MPAYINQRPVKTGCWTDREDELLAEWQGKYGNRSPLPINLHFHAWATVQLSSLHITLQHDMVTLPNTTNTSPHLDAHLAACLKVVHGGEKDLWQDWTTVRSALATQGEQLFIWN